MASVRKCFSKCEFFRCGQRAIQMRGNVAYCRFADDICDGAICKYALCVRNRLLADGICGLTVKRVSNILETNPEEVVKGVKIKGKLQRRLKEKELF